MMEFFFTTQGSSHDKNAGFMNLQRCVDAIPWPRYGCRLLLITVNQAIDTVDTLLRQYWSDELCSREPSWRASRLKLYGRIVSVRLEL